MKPGRKKYNDDVKEDEDRLSDLPDCVILHILSFLDTIDAVQTCILSKRWNNLWKYLPTLALLSSTNKFVSRILSLRNASTPLRALHFQRHGTMYPRLLQRMIKYAVSHHVQELSINLSCDIQHFPTCLFSCHTLTSLKLVINHPTLYAGTLFPSSLNLPALATLFLESFTFPVDDDGHTEPFSAFSSLNSLIIRGCKVLDEQNLWILSATLANLTLDTGWAYNYGKIELSTPSLCTFVFVCIGGFPALKLHGIESNLSSVKHVKIDVSIASRSIDVDISLVLLNWLVELANIKSLTINHNALEVLSKVPDLLKVEFHSLCSLKSLRVKTRTPSCIPNGTFDFLLQNSPSTKVEIIDPFRSRN